MRILAAFRPGTVLGDVTLRPNGERERHRIDQHGMTEPLDWYTGPSPWGGPIAAPSAVVDLLYARLLDDACACDAGGELIADMRMMLRQLKQSSPLYQTDE